MKKIDLEWLIYAEPKVVYEALTVAKIIEKWTGEDAVFELKKGGHVELFGGWVVGDVIDFKKNESISFTWKPSEWDKKAKPSIVKYRLEKDNAGTKLIVEHENFPSEIEAKKHKDGWVNHVFDPLNDYLILGAPQKVDL
ncbi:MAG: hypothetical protein HKN22_05025 [Bacteroidia bacterium]|nr:hypothetical protein [Bacteroidia bacterium]